ncbi:DNA cytosine methyltransferase [Prosthecobacter dejongeii]|uniref:DNA (cytosine-5-)-methyltransferase n=1 Tax=Prosthecobacter dejongeii TaxID=48465 RepID=A0A7W8DPJ6_9BACT|nr:DNA cytosine methyltransferase [Prosthecobacter dejongeii]MBB5037220.1 DNA (cytosine-5)-methyltransferase 1 [Prosthecobacter dejongeii]
MRSVEIFSGAGGLAKGLDLVGFDHAAFVEWNKDACSSLRLNFSPERVYCGDIKDYDFSKLGQVDVVAGGPPCQPFSLGGKHQANLDHRDMFPYAIRSIEVLQPKLFIFENVKGLLRESFADYFSYILFRLGHPCLSAEHGIDWRDHLNELLAISPRANKGTRYSISHRLVNAADYGVPQCRERVIIVGVREDIDQKWQFPKATHTEERLLYDQYVTGEYWDRHRVPQSERPQLSPSLAGRIEAIKRDYVLFAPEGEPWRTTRDVLGDVPHPNENHGIPDHIFRDGARSYPGHTGSCYDLPAKTIKAGGHGVPGGENMIRYPDGSIRYFTVFEAKRIQTFPDDYVITGAWGEALRQIGNAVPVKLAECLGNAAKTLLTTPASHRQPPEQNLVGRRMAMGSASEKFSPSLALT